VRHTNSHIVFQGSDHYLSIILIVGRIPHTASNKIDRNTLAHLYAALDILAWEKAISQLEVDGDLPEWTQEEIDMRTIISELTGADPETISRATELPALGIDSVSGLKK
jgi:hypothetical protein